MFDGGYYKNARFFNRSKSALVIVSNYCESINGDQLHFFSAPNCTGSGSISIRGRSPGRSAGIEYAFDGRNQCSEAQHTF
jgi:hypothetical protein